MKNAFEDHDVEDDDLEGHDLEEDEEDEEENLITCPRCGATWVESQIPSCECELLGLLIPKVDEARKDQSQWIGGKDQDTIVVVIRTIFESLCPGIRMDVADGISYKRTAIDVVAAIRKLGWRATYDPISAKILDDLKSIGTKFPDDPVTDAEIEAGAVAMRQQFEEAKTTSTDGQVPYRNIVRAVLLAARKVKP